MIYLVLKSQLNHDMDIKVMKKKTHWKGYLKIPVITTPDEDIRLSKDSWLIRSCVWFCDIQASIKM